MTDAPTTTTPPAGTDPTGTAPEVDETDVDPQAQADKWKALARKHQAEAKKNADAAARLAEIEDANKSESERLTAATQDAIARATAAESALLRFQVAAELGVPAALAARLQGNDEAELREDAERLLALMPTPPEGGPPKAPPARFDGGPRGTGESAKPDPNENFRRFLAGG
jgi:hypothetical protein